MISEDRIEYLKENALALIQIFMLLVLISLSMFQSSNLFVKETKYLGKDALKERICTQGFLSIANKEAEESLFEESIYKALVNSNYEVFPLEIEGIYDATTIDEGCKIISKDSKGLRSFTINLSERGSFNYQISNIKENKVTKEDV